MAHHVARGDEVHVLTCTLGEEGEVIPPGLAHLEGHPEDPLGPHRHAELTEALRRVGAHLHVLGAHRGRLSRYRDSGMAGSPAAQRPEAFVNADPVEAADLVAQVVREVQPDVVVTYDPHGGYRHPDHIQTHRVTRAALARLDDADLPAAAFEVLTPESWARADRAWLRHRDPAAYARPDPGPPLVVPAADAPYPPSVVDDDRVTHHVVDPAARAVKNDALRAHATQVIVVSEDVHALSNLIAVRTTDREGFAQVDPRTWASVPGARGDHLTG
jgi:N-acetyl-1-D-myo-inositol-2-amino-2-deoxy-alpha-D-glucopyranoside deacetylase